MYRPNKRGYDTMRGHRDNYRDRSYNTERELMQERENKEKIAEELQRREQQLVMTSNLLQKQSMMLKNLESNMMVQNVMNQQHPVMMGVRGVQTITPQFQRPVAQVRLDPPASKRLKENPQQQDRRQNKDRGQSSSSMHTRRNRRYRNIEKILCFLCRLKGHFARDCPNSKEGETSTSKTTQPDSKKGEVTKKTSVRKSLNSSSDTSSDKDLKKFCNLCLKKVDMNIHLTDPEHVRKSNCKVCGKNFNTAENYVGHKNSSIHKALINKKKQMIDAKLKPFSSDKITGSEYVVPVTGFFCKLCKKFYNKEQHAKVDHCKTKAHYDQVANLMCTKYEAAIYAKFKEIAESLDEDRSRRSSRDLLEAVRKADFITGLKYIKNTKNKTEHNSSDVAEKPESGGEELKKEEEEGDGKKEDERKDEDIRKDANEEEDVKEDDGKNEGKDEDDEIKDAKDKEIENDGNYEEKQMENDAILGEELDENDAVLGEELDENDAIKEDELLEKDAVEELHENDLVENDAVLEEDDKDEDNRKEQEEDEEMMEHPDDLDMEVLDSVEDDVDC